MLTGPKHSGTVCVLTFLSGAAVLIFETLWFRSLGLVIGNTAATAAILLGAFMFGQAIGLLLIRRQLDRFENPLRSYAAIEVLIAVIGVAALYCFFLFSNTAIESQWIEWGQIALSFALLLIPAALMGWTLPLLIRWLEAGNATSYATSLSALYGCNTAGAVVGTSLAGFLLIPQIGLVHTATCAFALLLIAAIIALLLPTRAAAHNVRQMSAEPIAKPIRPGRWTTDQSIAALSGFSFLVLEILWLRLGGNRAMATEENFSLMLAVILAGLSFGGMLGGRLAVGNLDRRIRWIATLAAVGSIVGYYVGTLLPASSGPATQLIFMSAIAGLPAVSSGILLVLVASNQRRHSAAGLATGNILLANFFGAGLGAVMGGFVLLPILGIGGTFCVSALCYAAIGLAAHSPERPWNRVALGVTPYVIVVISWPWLASQQRPTSYTTLLANEHTQLISHDEGVNASVGLFEERLFDQTIAHRIVTGAYSMTSTHPDSRRYMKLFAWLPQALHPAPQSALLISYGAGSTAEALLADNRLTRLDIVDPEQKILNTSQHIFQGSANPLDDARSQVHLSDGRYYLKRMHSSPRGWDIITGEPPPPRLAGIVNLYTAEYFQLLSNRLNPGGIASYWLPVDQLSVASTKAVLSAFCQAVDHCSLWAGANYNWIMLGHKGRIETAKHLRPTASSLDRSALGITSPAAIAGTFIADAEQLVSMGWIGEALSDHHPGALEGPAAANEYPIYAALIEGDASWQRATQSSYLSKLLPNPLLDSSQPWFQLRPILNNEIAPRSEAAASLVVDLLRNTNLNAPIAWLLGSNQRRQFAWSQQAITSPQPDNPQFLEEQISRQLLLRDFAAANKSIQFAHARGVLIDPFFKALQLPPAETPPHR